MNEWMDNGVKWGDGEMREDNTEEDDQIKMQRSGEGRREATFLTSDKWFGLGQHGRM